MEPAQPSAPPPSTPSSNEPGFRASLARSCSASGRDLFLRARYPAALSLFELARARLDATDNRADLIEALTGQAEVLAELGRLEEASALLQAAETQAQGQPEGGMLAGLRLAQARMALRRGRLAEAEQTSADARSQAARFQLRPTEFAAAALQAYLAALRGDRIQAKEHLSIARPPEGDEDPRDRILGSLARGLIAAGRRARDEFQQALDAAQRWNAPEWAWRCHQALALAWTRAGDARRARQHFQAAAAGIEALAAELPRAWRDGYLQDPDRQVALEDARAQGQPTADDAGAAVAASPAAAPPRVRDDGRILTLLSGLLKSDLARDRIFDLILSMVVEATGAERGFLVRVDSQGELSPESARNIDSETIEHPEMKFSTSLIREAIAKRKILRIGRASMETPFRSIASVMALGLQSVMVVPIIHENRVRGVIYLDHRYADHHFEDDDARLAEACAEHCAPLFAHFLVHQETERELERVRRLYQEAQRELSAQFQVKAIVGRSAAIREVLRLVERVAPMSQAVLITGESGTGKELVARAIHYSSPRKDGPFVAENCAAFAETMLEAQLFGHVKGAFTGATDDHPGLLELAHGGTFFLDEITEMSPALQRKLLRVVEDGQFRPIGAAASRSVKVRFMAATNRDPQEALDQGHLLPDLYFRLATVQIKVPPLRERLEDIPLLVRHFLDQISGPEGEARPEIEPKQLAALMGRPWPGNVRELRNVVEQLVVLGPDHSLKDSALSFADERPRSSAGLALFELPFQEARAQFVAMFLRRALAQNNGNVAETARAIGMDRASLHQSLYRHGIKARAFKVKKPAQHGP